MTRAIWVQRKRGDSHRIRIMRPDRPISRRDRRLFALERARRIKRRAYQRGRDAQVMARSMKAHA
jgi:hypothetical protein